MLKNHLCPGCFDYYVQNPPTLARNRDGTIPVAPVETRAARVTTSCQSSQSNQSGPSDNFVPVEPPVELERSDNQLGVNRVTNATTNAANAMIMTNPNSIALPPGIDSIGALAAHVADLTVRFERRFAEMEKRLEDAAIYARAKPSDEPTDEQE